VVGCGNPIPECLTPPGAVKLGCLRCGLVGGLTAPDGAKGRLGIGLPPSPGCGLSVVEPEGALARSVSKPPQGGHLLHHYEPVRKDCTQKRSRVHPGPETLVHNKFRPPRTVGGGCLD